MPTAPLLSVSLGTGPFYVNSVLSADVSYSEELQSNVTGYEFRWFVGDVEVIGQTSETFVAPNFKKKDRISVKVTVLGGDSHGLSAESRKITILNSPPEIKNVAIVGGPFTTAEDLLGEVETIDADGDPLTLAYRWYVNWLPVTDSTNFLPANRTQKGDVVSLEVTARDSDGEKASIQSTPVQIVNSPPLLLAASLGPTSAFSNSVLEVTLGEVYDADLDTLTFSYSWLVDDVLVDGASGPTLDGQSFHKGQVVTAVIAPFDGELFGVSLYSNSVTVSNAPPSFDGVVLIASEPVQAGDNLSLEMSGWVDIDGDLPDYRIQWYANGVSVVGQTKLSYDAVFVRDDVISAKVWPYDGQLYGDPRFSNSVTVANTPPSAPQVQIYPLAISDQAPVMWAGISTDLDPDGDYVSHRFDWYRNGAIQTYPSVQTDVPLSDRMGGDTWTVRVTPNDGFADGATSWASTFIKYSAIDVSAGNNFSCALSSHGVAMCWGSNQYGKLGDGTTVTTRPAPSLVSDSAAPQSNIMAGQFHSCSISAAGDALCWGANSSGQLGDGTTISMNTPVFVSGITKEVVQIVGGNSHTCGLLVDSTVACWGYNGFGQLGHGRFSPDPHMYPIPVTGLVDIVAIAAGDMHTCALSRSGSLKCWGRNGFGQLGLGSTYDQSAPEEVAGLTTDVTAVTAGYEHTCALMKNGTAKCWGDNGYGQLGNGDTVDQLSPVEVTAGSEKLVQIEAGSFHTCALTEARHMRCWGRNNRGQLGDSSRDDKLVPTSGHPTLVPLRQISAGHSHTCAIGGRGEVYCWGDNIFGELGAGNTSSWELTPVKPVGF
jgi:alpha-tubulin suppressor-like RCC1 family protein